MARSDLKPSSKKASQAVERNGLRSTRRYSRPKCYLHHTNLYIITFSEWFTAYKYKKTVIFILKSRELVSFPKSPLVIYGYKNSSQLRTRDVFLDVLFIYSFRDL